MKRNRLETVKCVIAPRSLRFQLLSRSLFILAGLLVLIGALQYLLMKDFLYRNQAETTRIQSRGLPRDLLERSGLVPPLPQQGNRNFSSETGRPRGSYVFLSDTSLAYVGSSGKFIDFTANNGTSAPRLSAPEYDSIREKLKNREKIAYKVVHNDAGIEQIIVFRPAEGPGGRSGLFQMGTSTAHLQTVLIRQIIIFTVLAAVALAGGLSLYLPVLRRTLHPLDQMVKTVEKTDAGSLDERLPVSQGQLEIDRLAESFNGMMERLQLSFGAEKEAKEQMRRFIADASHELRTPLTSIHGFLEVLLRGAADKREHLYTALSSMHGESTRIKKLVEDLLMLAKLDRAPELQMTETRLDDLVLEMEPHLRLLAGTRSVRLDLSPGIRSACDPDKIKQVVLNLFHNAVQHTDPQTGNLSVSLTADPNRAEINVIDNGDGIAEQHLPHLFERFYRSDGSRTRRQGGAGLGLAISQSIVQAHGGRISVNSRLGEGSVFSVSLFRIVSSTELPEANPA